MVVALLLIAAVATLFSSKPLQISHDTSYITAPLTTDGKRVNYLAAIEQTTRPENAATKQNGYRLLVQHLAGTRYGYQAFSVVMREEYATA